MCATHAARHSAQLQDCGCISEHTQGSVPSPVMNVANLLHSVLPLLFTNVTILDIDLISVKYAARSLLQKQDLITIGKRMGIEGHSVGATSIDSIQERSVMSGLWGLGNKIRSL